MNTTTRRHPRTTEQAFGPLAWPISGPYRRGSRALNNLVVSAVAVACVITLLLAAVGLMVR